jgi:hypothetical protein
MDDVTVQDLISLSYDQKPIDFQNAFNSLMSDRITNAINDKKIEVAQSMFGSQEEEDTETELEDQDQEEQTDGETT